MDINTAVISLDRLRELELAEKKLQLPRSKTIITITKHWRDVFRVDTDDECDEILAYRIKDQEHRIENLLDEIKSLKKEFDKVEKLNYWGFCEWRKLTKLN
jgi:hypothetical protein|tara:strand:+ start:2396 stop:2698 length:303 start_codon:yes stop_codon:yes gene_type:complete